MGTKVVRGGVRRRSPRLLKVRKALSARLKRVKESSEKKLNGIDGIPPKLEHLDKKSELTGYPRRSPRLRNVSRNQKPRVGLKRKQTKLGKILSGNHVLSSEFLDELPSISSFELTEYPRRSPRLKNVSRNLKPRVGLKKKQTKLGKISSGKHVLNSKFLDETPSISSSEVKPPLEESQVCEEQLRMLIKVLNIKWRRSKRTRRETGFHKLIISNENKESKKDENNEKLFKDYNKVSSVKDLLMTGLFERASVTYISKNHQVKFPGIISGTGYLCGCSNCNYTQHVLSARQYKIHAGCHAFNPNENIFVSNGVSIFELVKRLNSTHKNALKYELEKIVSELEFRKTPNHGHGCTEFDRDSPNGDSISTIQEIVALEPVNINLKPQAIETNPFQPNVGPTSIVPYTPCPTNGDSILTIQEIVALEPVNINSKAHAIETNPFQSSVGPTAVVPYTPSLSNGGSSSGINANAGPDLMVPVTPGPSNKNHILRRARSPRSNRFKNRDKERNNLIGFHNGIFKSSFENCAHVVKNNYESPSQKVRFLLCGTEDKSAIEKDPDWNRNYCRLKTSLNEKKMDLVGGTILKKRKRNFSLHRRVFDEDGLADGTFLTYRNYNKILLKGHKHGDFIVCSCHNHKMNPSQFEAHAGMPQRRKPYHNIYTPEGKTLHDLSLELASVSNPNSEVQVKFTFRSTDSSRRVSIIPTNCRLTRVLQTQKGIIVSCSICMNSSASLGDENHSKLIIFCNQCDKAYHVGCLENKELFNIEDVYNKIWFCSTNCTWVNTSLKNLCTNGPNPIPSPFLDLLKRQNKERENSVNIEWQIFTKTYTQNESLLLEALDILKSAFKPVYEVKRNLLKSMVYGKEIVKKGLDFHGVFCVALKVDGEIVCIAMLRVFGQFVAEIPLITTSKQHRRKGYFKMLLSLIEELLGLLQVRLILAPVQDKMQSIWMNKFGFVKTTYQKVQMLKEQHAIMVFEDTEILEKVRCI